MLDSIAHRGPDHDGVWSGESVALGNCLLRTTPESMHERLPLTSSDGRYTIAADARIDNREELLETVHVDGDKSAITDSALILEAYRQLGEDCVLPLVGPFAFAIWDDRERRLFCARDHIGVRPFYYSYRSGSGFSFGSEIKAVLLGLDVSRAFDEHRLADFMIPSLHDKVRTSFRDVLRLPPAHTLTFERGDLRVHEYWRLNPDYELELESEEAYKSAFLEVLTEAVRCRTRGIGKIGTQLSGGLDSSAVSTIAHCILEAEGRLPVRTFSTIFDRVPQCDERKFIHEVLSEGGYGATFVEGDDVGPLTHWDQMMAQEDEAFTIGNYTLPWTLLSEARAQDVRVVLDGLDGDTAIWHGDGYLSELARNGRWRAFIEEAFSMERNNPSYHSAKGLFYRHAVPELEQMAQEGHWARLIRGIFRLGPAFGIGVRRGLRTYFLKQVLPASFSKRVRRFGRAPQHRGAEPATTPPTVDLRASQLGRKEEASFTTPRSSRRDQWEKLTSGIFAYALETYDRIAASHFVDARHPFMDRRLIEFSLALPPQYKLRDGWTRWIMRAALEGILPPAICWRPDKTDLTPNFVRALVEIDADRIASLMSSDTKDVEAYVNMEHLKELYRQILTGSRMTPAHYNGLWRGMNMMLWLRRERRRSSHVARSVRHDRVLAESAALAAAE